jgi:hypothetical protein
MRAKEPEMKWMLFVVLSSAFACKSTCKLPVEDTPAEKPAIDRPANSGPGMEHAEQAQGACVATCERENAMRAVSAEVITADCLASCTGEGQTLGTKSLE